MTAVYLLWHLHRLDDDEDEKLIGVYSTAERAIDTVGRLATQPGFADLPDLITDDGEGDGGFLIVAYTVDEDQWVEGYTTD